MYLHTNLQYTLIKLQFDISVKLGVLPFIWDAKSKKYKNDTKAFKFSILTNISLYTIQYLFVMWNIMRHVILYRNLPITGKLFYSSLWLIIFTLQQLLLYMLYFKCDEFITLLNTLKFYSDRIAGVVHTHLLISFGI